MKIFLSKVKSRITISLGILILLNSPVLSQSFDFNNGVTGNGTPEISQMKEDNTLSVKSEGVNLCLKSVTGISPAYEGFTGYVVTTNGDCIKKLTISLKSGEFFNLDKIDIQERHCSDLNLVLTAKSGSDVKGSVTISFTPSQGKTIDLSANAFFKNITSVEITSATKDACCGDYTYWIALDNVVISNVHQPLGVSSVTPDNGPVTGGTTVTIGGTGFQYVQAVKFGSADAKSFNVNSATSITAVSPAASAGTVDVTVITANGTSEINDNDKFTYHKLSQIISFDNPGNQSMGTSPELTATATSGLAPVFTSATTDVCTITTGGTLTLLKPGSCTINADQAGNETYQAAPTVSQTFEVISSVPGKPTHVTATPGNAQATVSFTAPASDGGSAIIKYIVKSNDGIIAEGTSTTITVMGLTNGTSYTFTVTAINAKGEGPASDPSNSVTPTCDQTISFNNPGDQVYGSTVKLTATATSGLPVTFISMTTDVCTVSGDEVTFKSAGACTISARQEGNHAFNPAPPVEQSFNVNPKTLTILGLSAEDKIYDGTTVATLTGTAVLTGVVSPDNVTLSGTPSAHFADAGVGTNKPVTVTGYALAGDASVVDNYTLQQPTGLTANITKATVVLSWDQPADITYGTALGNAQLNATSNITGTFAYTPAAGTILNAGSAQTLSVTFTPSDLINYQVVSKNVTINVIKAPLNVVADNIQITYGSAVPPLTYQYNGFVNGENSSVLDAQPVISVESTPVNAGTYSIVVSGGSDNNYSFSYVNGTLTITKAVAVLSWDSPADITYGTALGNAQLNATSNITGTFAYTPAAGTILNAGSAQTLSVTFTPADLINYQVVSKNVTINVTKVPLNVVADNIQITYGSAVPPLTYQYSGFVNGENSSVLDAQPVISVESTPVNAGSYSIVVSGGSDNNYTFSYKNGTLTITKAAAILSWDQPADITYGTALGNAQLNATSNITGTFAYTPAAGTILNAGSAQTLSVTFTPADLINYQIVSKNVTINVTKAPLNVVADNIQIIYGSAVPPLTYQYSGFVNGENSSVLDTHPVISVESFPVNAGTYSIVVSGGSDNNYTFNYVNGTLTINPLTLSIGTPVLTTSKTYDGNNLAVVTPGAISGVPAGKDVHVEASALYDNPNVGIGKTITVSYVLTGADKGNYQTPANYVVNTGVITAKQLTITDPVVVKSKEYDGNTIAAITSIGQLNGVVTGDEGKVSVSASANYNDASVSNNKTITVVYTLTGSAAGNYIAPANNVITGASIILKLSLSLENPKAGCDGGALQLPFTILEGSANSYRIVFADAALAAGFSNIGFTPLASGNVISIAVPKGVKDGTYDAFLQIKNDIVSSELYKFTFTINLTSDYLVKKFNDVILVDNSSNRFTSYQWYKNGTIINGARDQFYNDLQGLSGTYHAVVTTVSGQTLEICPVTYNVATIKAMVSLKTYPNPAFPGNTIKIEIEGLSDEQLKGAVLSVFSNLGEKISSSAKVETVNTITSGNNAGIYFVRLATADGNVITQKITITQ